MWIERHVLIEDSDGEIRGVDPNAIGSLYDPAVLLGDAGMGKTALMRRVCERRGETYIHAARLLRADDPGSLMPDFERVHVDGLDEIASPGRGSALDAVLGQLVKAGKPKFTVSCRSAEWHGAVDRARIEGEYGREARTFYLMPFDGDEARAFLKHEFPGVGAHALLEKVENRALIRACMNPLNLRLFGEIARAGGGLPRNRTELFARGCRAMLGHDGGPGIVPPVRSDEDDLLLASGAICATLLLCDLPGVHDGPVEETPPGFLNLSEVCGLPFAGAAADALGTRLFQADGEGRFSCLHRAIAEYLGAAWLSHCVAEGPTGGRILSLFDPGGGVPAALRGLHAWIARLSPALAAGCFAADPYAVLRDGEMETLAPDRARTLLAALKERSGEDPCFDAEDRGVHRASGLMRRELKDDIFGILAAPGPHSQLSAFLVEAIGGTDLSEEDGRLLESILFDRGRDCRERAAAFRSLDAKAPADDEAVVLRLLDLGDAGSARLACEILGSAEPDDGRARSSRPADRREAKPGGEDGTEPQAVASPDRKPFGALDTARLAALLDFIAEGAPAAVAEVEDWQRETLTDIGRTLAARVLEADSAVEPARVWAWIRWTGEAGGAAPREGLAEIFGREHALRAAVLEHALTTPHPGGVWSACMELRKTGLGIGAAAEDHDRLAEALRIGSEKGSIDPETWRDIIETARPALHYAGLERAAAPAADGEREAGAEWGEPAPSVSAPPTARDRDGGFGAGTAAQADGQSHRAALAGQAGSIEAGDFRVLALPAAVYLGRFDRLGENVNGDPSLAPRERLRGFLGEDLCERVLNGFVAVLGRTDLPHASAIAQMHCAGDEHEAEAPLICGVDVALHRGLPLDTIERAALEAAYMAWRRVPMGVSGGRIDIESALEQMVFTGVEDMERHFRASIEPQLACNAEFVRELDSLGGEYGSGFHELAGRLSLEWLRAYPQLHGQAQMELMTCALEDAPRDAVRRLIVDCRDRAHPDEHAKLSWLSVACVVDLKGYRDALLDAAEYSPDFIAFVRERIGSAFLFGEVPLDTLRFLAEVFGKRWPRMVERPGSSRTGRGWNDPRDASVFIERTIHAIASRPGPEAEDVLRNLIDNHAPSYADRAKEALAIQRMTRRDREHVIPTVAELQELIADATD